MSAEEQVPEPKPNRLAEWLAHQEPVEDFPEIDDLPCEPEDIFGPQGESLLD